MRARMVERAEAYPWFFAQAHCGMTREVVLSTEFPQPGVITEWSVWPSEVDEENAVDFIRRQTKTGRPCGSVAFASHLESLLGRSLCPGKASRKRKAVAGSQGSQREKGVVRTLFLHFCPAFSQGAQRRPPRDDSPDRRGNMQGLGHIPLRELRR